MIVNVNEVYYHVKVYGQGDPLLMLHGFTGDITTWNSFQPKLSNQFQLILIDILGHGKTDSPIDENRYQIERVAEDIKEILIQLSVNRINIIGYSMGGRLALTFATNFPYMVNKLILESSTPGLKTEVERSDRREKDYLLATQLLEEGVESFVKYWTNIPLFQTQKKLDPSTQEVIKKQRLSNNPIGLANSLKGMGTGSMPSLWNQLQYLNVPVLIITGSLDEKFCRIADEMKKLLPNVKHETVLNVGHAIHVEDSQKFGTIIKEFLSN